MGESSASKSQKAYFVLIIAKTMDSDISFPDLEIFISQCVLECWSHDVPTEQSNSL